MADAAVAVLVARTPKPANITVTNRYRPSLIRLPPHRLRHAQKPFSCNRCCGGYGILTQRNIDDEGFEELASHWCWRLPTALLATGGSHIIGESRDTVPGWWLGLMKRRSLDAGEAR
jgi:hypothetical protein